MKDEQKRQMLLDFLAAEQTRMRTTASILHSSAELDAIRKRAEHQQAVFEALNQNGITWDELKAEYDKAFQLGERDMLNYRMSFFYAAAAIAFHEQYEADPEKTAAFISSLSQATQNETSRDVIIKECLDETGVDVCGVDTNPAPQPYTRKDKAAVERMKRTGITQRDLEYERKTGYQNGWSRTFYLSLCYAAVAMTLRSHYGAKSVEIEFFLERITQIQDEEICSNDIIERAKEEAGVDVSGLARR